MKKITILCIFLTFVTLFIVSCTDSGDISESVTEVIFPDDIPIYPGAVQTMGYQIGFLTTANYNIDADYIVVQQWFDDNLGSPWEVEIDWFQFGEGNQKNFITSNFNPNPNEPDGRKLQLSVGPNDDNHQQTIIIIMHTDYTN